MFEALVYLTFTCVRCRTEPITAVFSRPVIALGSDYAPLASLSIDGGGHIAARVQDSPFNFSLCGEGGVVVRGKLRWVATYIARFDPDSPWPTDMCLEVCVCVLLFILFVYLVCVLHVSYTFVCVCRCSFCVCVCAHCMYSRTFVCVGWV